MTQLTKQQREQRHKEVDINYDYFLEQLENNENLTKEHKNDFVLIRHKQFVRFFKDEKQAIQWGNETYPDRMFSIQPVDDKPVMVGYGIA